MTVTIPEGQPNRRFMRYVRPPTEVDKHSPLFPLQPQTRRLRLGIDVETVPTPPAGLFSSFIGREEIDLQLLVPNGSEPPTEWLTALQAPLIHKMAYTTVDEATPFLDTVQFGVTTETETSTTHARVSFFPVLQQLDDQVAPGWASPLDLEQRHRAAAYAAAAAHLGIDAVVSMAKTTSRSDVPDNDVVISISPDDAVGLIGHYLRVTSNPVVNVRTGSLSKGSGTWRRATSTGTVTDLYERGIATQLAMLECFEIAATLQSDAETLDALRSIRVRIMRSARALDSLLSALSNPAKKRRKDVVERAAEAFDRQLLYLAAAFDIYGRRFLLLIDPNRNPRNYRFSLDASGFVTDHLEKEYDADLLTELRRLHVYATVCKELRNHIHDGILPVDQHPDRTYGSSLSIALKLDPITKLLPGATGSKLTQDHYDQLGVWRTQPVDFSDTPSTVADLATVAVTLMRTGISLINEFSQLIMLHKPRSASAPSPLLGCVNGSADEKLVSPEDEELHKALFGWPST